MSITLRLSILKFIWHLNSYVIWSYKHRQADLNSCAASRSFQIPFRSNSCGGLTLAGGQVSTKLLYQSTPQVCLHVFFKKYLQPGFQKLTVVDIEELRSRDSSCQMQCYTIKDATTKSTSQN
ncbi:hypothetical protein AV530_011131 [Patagioenas fasciata monilis]|uniref:Uncharacterized protein n=1 Tax=Patagioenas fasciata monilis TaxID=372326 RepID=A0A1V4KCW1_PATFA|nr:hypothetical protein AV530_011131 [Patagioenas fasciata monilis]